MRVIQIRQESGWYLLDDAWRCRRLVGAGGTRCPVYRTLFREKAKGDAIRPHWQALQTKLAKRGLVPDRTWDAGGYTYYLRGRRDLARHGDAYLAGDAAGLATTDLAGMLARRMGWA